MRTQMKHVLAVLAVLSFSLDLANAAGSLDAELEQLKTIDCVTGSAVGIGEVPGKFYKLSKIFVQKGTEEDFLKLASDENPVAKCMGLLCLAQHKKSVNILKKHLSDEDIISYQPYGCMRGSATVGLVAVNLLHDANYLEHRGKPLRVLSEEELIGLDLEILARDSTIKSHDVSRTALFIALVRKGIALTLSDLSKYAPRLETHEIIKAIGRLGASDVAQSKRLIGDLKRTLPLAQPGRALRLPKPDEVADAHREFLILCLHDKRLDESSRLAAASGLTRDTSEAAMDAIERQEVHLNDMEGENWGDIFLDTVKRRRLHEKHWKIIRTRDLSPASEEFKIEFTAIHSNSHPSALPRLEISFYTALRNRCYGGSVREVVGRSLLEMSRNLVKFGQPWNTYSDTAYGLKHILNMWGKCDIFGQVFTETERLEFETNVRNAIKEDSVK